jgi:carbonic anhydrase
VEALLAAHREDSTALVGEAVRERLRVSVDHLRHGSELLEALVRKDDLLVVGAEYRWKLES